MNKILLTGIILVIIGMIFNFAVMPTVKTQETAIITTPTPVKEPIEKVLYIGDEGILNINKDKNNCNGEAILGVTKDYMSETISLTAVKDDVGIMNMILTDKAIAIKNCTKIKIIGAGITYREIRILDGSHAGESAFTPFEWVRN